MYLTSLIVAVGWATSLAALLIQNDLYFCISVLLYQNMAFCCLHTLPIVISLTTLFSLSRSAAICSAPCTFCTFLLSPVLFCPSYFGFPRLLATSILPCTSRLANSTPTAFLPSLQSFCSSLASAHSVSAVRFSSPFSSFLVTLN